MTDGENRLTSHIPFRGFPFLLFLVRQNLTNGVFCQSSNFMSYHAPPCNNLSEEIAPSLRLLQARVDSRLCSEKLEVSLQSFYLQGYLI
jgi:hypothetical protein